MSERYIVIPNWDDFQHYKDKTRPAWIKLYPRLLRHDEFLNLTPTERMALVGIWMLYAESARRIAVDTAKLTRSLNQRITKNTLQRLNEAGFIEFCSRDALDAVISREEKRRIETPPTPPNRGGGNVNELKPKYTGCRFVYSGSSGTYVQDPLGLDKPPAYWPHSKPTRAEIRNALASEGI